jgi:hypothetical protein
MKRVLMTILASVLWVSASTAQSLNFQTFTDSLGIKQKNIPIWSAVEVDFPVSGPSKLVNALKKSLAACLGVAVADAQDGNTFANKVVNKNIADLKKGLEDDDMVPELYYNNVVKKVYENDKLLTIMYGGNVFYGGAHEDHFAVGVTYRKTDGKSFGTYDILNEDAWDQIQDKVAASLRKFFDVKTNREMADELMGDGIICTNKDFYLPMPENPPFVDNGDLVFIYATYEIASFAAGMPEVRIPLKDIQQHLKAGFKALVK